MVGIDTNKEFIVAVDIAKKRDYTTIQVYRITPDVRHFPRESGRPNQIVAFLDLVYMAKYQAIRYTEQATAVMELLKRVNLMDNSQLLVDGTGVGEAVVDIMREQGLMPLPIVFTGGSEARPVYAEFGKVFGGSSTMFRTASVLKEMHVPKEDLVHAGMIIMQQGRMRVAPNLQHADDFKRQLMSFKGKVNEKTGRTKYENESDDIHDDFVVTYLMAAWWMTYKRVTESEDRVIQEKKNANWDPFAYLD